MDDAGAVQHMHYTCASLHKADDLLPLHVNCHTGVFYYPKIRVQACMMLMTHTLMCSGRRLCSRPRVLGTTQYVHFSLQPWITLTQAVRSESRRGAVTSSRISMGSVATTWAP